MSKKLLRTYIIVGVLCVAFYLTCGLWSHFGIAQLYIWPAAAVGCFLAAISSLLPIPKSVRIAVRTCLCLGLAALIALCIPVTVHMFDTLPDGLDYVIVLGARVDENGNPSLALRHRLESAEAYARRSPDTVFICSGGQGNKEGCTEAQCMYNYLTAAGVAPERLIIEDQSNDTAANFTNSAALIADPGASVGFITNNFHVCRSLLLARRSGLTDIRSCGAEFTGPLLIHYIVREALGLVAEKLAGNI